MQPRLSIMGMLITLLMVAACAPRRTNLFQSAPASPTPSARTTITRSQENPSSTVTPFSSIPFKDSTLEDQLDPGTGMFLLAPVDPANGKKLKGYAPINVGSVSPSYTFSPDKKTLIFVSYASTNSPSQPMVHFLNLSSWEDSVIPLNELQSSGWVSSEAISPDGTRFALSVTDKTSAILLVDVPHRNLVTQAATPYVINNLQFTTDGTNLMVYGKQQDPNTGLIQGTPVAELLSASDLKLVWSIKLDNVRDGFKLNNDFKGSSIFDPGAGTLYSPGIVFSLDENILYLVHADIDKLTRVDFSRKSVVTLDIRPKLSWFEQFLMLSAQNVYAKGQDGIELQAAISPDGGVIYTAGMQNKLNKMSNGDLVFTQIPLNLEAISASTGEEIFKSEATASEIRLSSDGVRLFLDQYSSPGYLTGTDEVDTGTGEIINQDKGLSLHSTHRMDGTSLLVSAAPPMYTSATTMVMTSFTTDHQLLGTWNTPDYAEWLSVP